MVSISRVAVFSSLGDNLRNILRKNIVRKIIEKNPFYEYAMLGQWNKAIE